MIDYFISYSYTNAHGIGFGNCAISLRRPIWGYDDIKVVTNILREQVDGDPVVLSFTRFDTDVEGGTR